MAGGERSPTFANYAIAGAAAGFCVDVCLFPVDTLKTRLQASGGNVNTTTVTL